MAARRWACREPHWPRQTGAAAGRKTVERGGARHPRRARTACAHHPQSLTNWLRDMSRFGAAKRRGMAGRCGENRLPEVCRHASDAFIAVSGVALDQDRSLARSFMV